MVTTMIAATAWMVWASGLLHFTVTQVRQLEFGTPAVRAYLDLQDQEGRPVTTLPDSSLSATLGPWGTELIQAAPFSTLNQGVAYVFLVDVSRSLSTELFDQMIGGIEAWIESLGPADQVAIIAFGETSRLLTDFTHAKEELQATLATLGPTDNETLLHQALADGLDLCRRLDPGLPGRRALVIFSDGKDEGSEFVAEDILNRIREDPTPIYAIGYSRLRNAEEREEFLGLLQRFATNSGGAFYGTDDTQFAEAYETIRQKIGEVWVADFACSDCRPDGSLHRLQVKVDLDGQVLSSGGAVRLLPLTTASGVPGQGTEGELSPAEPEPQAPAPKSDSGEGRSTDDGFAYSKWLIGLALLILGVAAWRWWSGRQQAEGEVAETWNETQSPVPPPIDPRSEAIIDPPKPPPYPGEERLLARPPAPLPTPKAKVKAPPIRARLVVVRGSRRGKQYSFLVDDTAVVGKRSSCTCVLTDETGIDAEQFELIHEEGGLFIRNLSEHLPTLISGGPINGKLRLSSDTLIGTGDTVLRIVFF